ncbi:MAG: MFS transporter, partial [Candidatus Limnocylindrales bacterium]|nr:MFS transporter [Candidatus Limnocylindrales bacterium]
MTDPRDFPPPADWRRGFLVQMLVAGLTVTAIHATRPTVTYRALDLGATTVEIGLIQSAFSILPALLAVAIGRAVDRVGASRYMIMAMVALSVGGVIAAYAGGLVLLALAQVAMGLGQIIYLVAGQALVANHGPRQDREVRFGHYATVNSIGQLAGPAIAAVIIGGTTGIVAVGMLASGGAGAPVVLPAVAAGAGLVPDNPEGLVFLVGTGLALLAVGLAFLLPGLTRRPDRPAERPAERGPGTLSVAGRVLRRPGMRGAMFVSIVVISTMDVLIAYLPAYGEATGLSVGLVGGLLSVRAGASLVSRLFMAPLIVRLGRARLLAVSMALAAVGMLGLPLATSPIVLFGIMIAIGLGLGLVQPMTIAWVANRSPRSERGTALGVRITGNRVALLIVPTLMGALAGAAGIAAI